MILKLNKDKTFDTSLLKDRLREGENLADLVQISGENIHDSLTLSNLAWTMVGVWQDYDEYAEDSVVVLDNGESCVFSWQPSENFTAHAGKLDIYLEGHDTENVVCIKIIGKTPITVKKAHRAFSVAVISTIESIIQRVNTSAQEAAQIAYEAAQTVSTFTAQVATILADIAGLKTSVETAQGTADTAVTNAETAQSTADNAQNTASAAQTSANGKVAKSGDTMTGGLGIGKQSATDTSDGCYFGTGGTMYFRRTNGNPFIAFYKGSGDKRQFLQGTDVTADVYLTLPATGGTLALADKQRITLTDVDSNIVNAMAYLIGGMVWFYAYIPLNKLNNGWSSFMDLGLPTEYEPTKMISLTVASDNSAVGNSIVYPMMWNGSYQGKLRVLTNGNFGSYTGNIYVTGCWPVGV